MGSIIPLPQVNRTAIPQVAETTRRVVIIGLSRRRLAFASLTDDNESEATAQLVPTIDWEKLMNPLLLFTALGPILFAVIVLAAIVALVMCGHADSPRAVRRALYTSFAPFLLTVIAIPVTMAIVPVEARSWYLMGKNCLAGLVVSMPALVWALLLMRSRGRSQPVTVAIDD